MLFVRYAGQRGRGRSVVGQAYEGNPERSVVVSALGMGAWSRLIFGTPSGTAVLERSLVHGRNVVQDRSHVHTRARRWAEYTRVEATTRPYWHGAAYRGPW
jgi:hypothetical protein